MIENLKRRPVCLFSYIRFFWSLIETNTHKKTRMFETINLIFFHFHLYMNHWVSWKKPCCFHKIKGVDQIYYIGETKIQTCNCNNISIVCIKFSKFPSLLSVYNLIFRHHLHRSIINRCFRSRCCCCSLSKKSMSNMTGNEIRKKKDKSLIYVHTIF